MAHEEMNMNSMLEALLGQGFNMGPRPRLCLGNPFGFNTINDSSFDDGDFEQPFRPFGHHTFSFPRSNPMVSDTTKIFQASRLFMRLRDCPYIIRRKESHVVNMTPVIGLEAFIDNVFEPLSLFLPDGSRSELKVSPEVILTVRRALSKIFSQVFTTRKEFHKLERNVQYPLYGNDGEVGWLKLDLEFTKGKSLGSETGCVEFVCTIHAFAFRSIDELQEAYLNLCR